MDDFLIKLRKVGIILLLLKKYCSANSSNLDINKTLFVILAGWDLTELEKAVKGRMI
jgi:hypothetical protein